MAVLGIFAACNNGSALFIHTGNQTDALGYITKIYLFDTAAVRVGGMYTDKPDKVLKVNSFAGSMNGVLCTSKAEDIATAVYQAVIVTMVVHM